MATRDSKTVTDTKDIPFTDKVIRSIQENRSAILGLFAAGLLIGVSLVGYSYFQKSKELRIESELYSFRSQIDKMMQDAPAPEGTKDQKTAAPEKPQFDKIESIASQWEKAIFKNVSSLSATTSAIDLAGTYMEYKKFDLAKQVLEKVKPSSGVLSSLVSNQLASVLFEMGDYKASIDNLTKVINSKSQSYLHPNALIKKGLSYYKLGKTDEAIAAFEQVADEFTGKPSAQIAEKYVRVLKFKNKKPAPSETKPSE